ncbi:MAG: membrane protein insertase YidC [Anaerolineae bacterium]|nr:membrane protein insertase YidC [Anaerolineae bacterium]
MWDLLIVNPMTNILLLLYSILGQNYVLAIIVFTLLIKLLTLPLTVKQQIGMMKMSALQPQIKEMQEKYKNDPRKMQEEMRKIGYNPVGGCLPMLIQMPILIGLFSAINRTLTVDPKNLIELGKHLYSFLPNISSLVPIDSTFLGVFDLGRPDRFLVIPILVVVTTFFSNKVMMQPTTDPQMAQTNQMMQWMMPMMFGFFMLSTPIGLGIYWIVSNILGLLQYYLTKPMMDKARVQYGVPVPGSAPVASGGAKLVAQPAQTAPPPKSKIRSKPSLGKPNPDDKAKK